MGGRTGNMASLGDVVILDTVRGDLPHSGKKKNRFQFYSIGNACVQRKTNVVSALVRDADARNYKLIEYTKGSRTKIRLLHQF